MVITYKNSIKACLMFLLLLGNVGVFAQSSDSDGDGILDMNDLCANTPSGTPVNAYGCPTSVANCDYNSSTITFNGTTPPAGKETRYVLANATDGKIIQVSNTPTFSGLTGTRTYMVLAFSYENNGTLVNLTTNNFLNQVSASCADWSNALVVKVCVPFVPATNCDYLTEQITLNTTTPLPSEGTTKYILVNSDGTIVKISDNTTFSGLSGTNTYNAYAVSYTGSIDNLSVGSNFSNISGVCFDLSAPISLKVCVCKPNICVPVVTNRIR